MSELRLGHKPDLNNPDVIASMCKSYATIGPDMRLRELCGRASVCITELHADKERQNLDRTMHKMSDEEVELSIRLARVERCAREFLAVSTCNAETSMEARMRLTQILGGE